MKVELQAGVNTEARRLQQSLISEGKTFFAIGVDNDVVGHFDLKQLSGIFESRRDLLVALGGIESAGGMIVQEYET